MALQPGDELASIDFESLIGGPLTAVIRAQSKAAATSVDFIRAVGFQTDDEGNVTEPQMVTFRYLKPVEKTTTTTDEAGNEVTETTIEPTEYQLTVPFLTMLPIPFIRVEETTIDFNAKITAVQYSKTTSKHGLDVELTAKAGWGWGSAKLKTNYSYQRNTTRGQKVNRTYSMNVNVRAVQDELPAGTERLLSILEGSIEETPVSDIE